nr:hypothetical protein [Tanacetum cinerariifolium]
MDYDQLYSEFNVGATRQANLLLEKDAEIAHLRSLLSLKEAEAAKAISLSGQLTMLEAADAARGIELRDLKEKNFALESKKNVLSKKVETLGSVATSKELSRDELNSKVSSLESERDCLAAQKNSLESAFELFKEQTKKMQDEQVGILSDRVVAIDFDLMEMVLHMDAEFYPRYLTTIAGRRWILGRGLKLVLSKCLSSPEYLSAIGEAIGRAIDKDMDLFNLISAPNPTKVKTGLCPRAAHEVLLLTATASRVIDMEDPNAAIESSGTPSTIEKSPLDFDNENPSQQITEGKGMEDQAQETVAPEISPGDVPAKGAIPEGLMAASHTITGLDHSHRQESPTEQVRKRWNPPLIPLKQGIFLPRYSVSGGRQHDLSSTSWAVHSHQPHHLLKERLSREIQILKSIPPSLPLFGRQAVYISLGQYNMNLARQVAMGSQLRLRFEQEEVHGLQNQMSNLKTLLEAEEDMKKAAEAKNADLTKELESLHTQFSDLQVSNDQLTQQVSTLQTQVTGEERIKAAFEKFKKYEDDRVEKRYAEMDARLDALNIDFDEELYPHMLTAIVGRRRIIGHDLRLSVMKCAEWIELRSSGGFKVCLNRGEMLLEDAIAANVSRAEKKKRCRVVCRTHGVGFAHHARSDGIPVSVPTVAPQGLAILLADVTT